MTTRDYIYIAGVGVSVISAIIALIAAYRTNKRDLNSLGDSELKTFEMIAKAELEFARFNMEIIEAEKESVDGLSQAKTMFYNALAQSVLNTYEIACQRFLDGKLDTVRFEKTYSARLKKIRSSEPYKGFIDGGNFNYSALIKVNEKLNNKE